MTRTKKPMSPLRLLLVGSAASATLIAAVPANAGPFDFIKRAVEKELRETLESATETAVQSALGGAVDATFKSEKGGMAQEADEGLRQEEHTTVGTADEIAAPAEERAGLLLPAVQPRIGTNGVNVAVGDLNGDGRADGKMTQNGTTVETASEVQAPSGEPTALLLPAVESVREAGRPARGKMSQNGTTVETASEVQASDTDQQASLLLPAVQKVREAETKAGKKGKVEANWKVEEGARARTREGMSQNGTTVESANTVQAPGKERRGLLLPAVQANRAAARPERRKMSQNGTTVSTASEVRAPEREQGYIAIDPKTGDARGKKKPKPASPR